MKTMKYELSKAKEILERTPATLHALLHDLSGDWTMHNEGGETWNVPQVIGHLIYSDTDNWLLRARLILAGPETVLLPSIDRFAQFRIYKDYTAEQLLAKFIEVRAATLTQIESLDLRQNDFEKKAQHPQFGQVSLSQLLSAWVAHDLTHISQISRIMAHQYRAEVGPWTEYLRILK